MILAWKPYINHTANYLFVVVQFCSALLSLPLLTFYLESLCSNWLLTYLTPNQSLFLYIIYQNNLIGFYLNLIYWWITTETISEKFKAKKLESIDFIDIVNINNKGIQVESVDISLNYLVVLKVAWEGGKHLHHRAEPCWEEHWRLELLELQFLTLYCFLPTACWLFRTHQRGVLFSSCMLSISHPPPRLNQLLDVLFHDRKPNRINLSSSSFIGPPFLKGYHGLGILLFINQISNDDGVSIKRQR